MEQLLDVFARLCVIFLEIPTGGHPPPKSVLHWVVGRVEGIGSCAGSEQSTMPGEGMLETKIGHEVSGHRGDAVVIERAMAREKERLRCVAPFQAFDVKSPKIPLCAYEVRGIRIEILGGESSDFRRPVGLFAQILFGYGRFGGVARLNDELGESIGSRGKRSRGEEPRELRDHRGFREIPRPDT